VSDHFSLVRGTVVVELKGEDGASERFAVDEPSRPGIFRPVVVPSAAGQRRVILTVESAAASEVHDLGEFTVFTSRAEADAHAGAEEGGEDEISYLLEQQWQIPFRIERADARPMRPNVPAFAELVLPPDADAIVAAPRDGRVVAVDGRLPSVGAEVAAGDLLFALSTSPDDGGDIATLELAVEQSEIAVDAARREVERLAPLVAQGVVAERRLDEARSALAAAEAESRSARRRRSSFGESQRVASDGERLPVPAPVAGSLAELNVAPGTWVTAGQALARIADRGRLWLDVGVPEAYLGRIDEVSGAWFTLDGVQGAVELSRETLVSVGTEVDRATRTLPVRFSVDNTRGELFAGMSTLAHLIVGEPVIVPAVPMEAIVDDAGTDVVYVQTGGESFVRRPVQLGVRDGAYVEVLAGVSPGEWVVVEGAYTVKLAASSTEAVGHGHAH
jgi:RND family efflux transporter MFP subunit